jgi:hypothetical protein
LFPRLLPPKFIDTLTVLPVLVALVLFDLGNVASIEAS